MIVGAGTEAVRRPDSFRRTATVDITCDSEGSQLTLRGAARDVLTGGGGAAQVVATAETCVTVEVSTGTVSGVVVTPAQNRRTDSLIGLPAGSGFRRALRRELPELVSDGSLTGLLLDEVPVATVIAGSLLRRRTGVASRARLVGPPVDVCAGWARGGLLATTTLAIGRPPLSPGPQVAPLTYGDDVHGWHPLSPLPAWSMRRARCIEIRRPDVAGAPYQIDSFFRDTRMTDDEVERGVHEYEISAAVDPAGTILSIEATPRVLPAPECPAAAASAQRLVGLPLRGLRDHVATSFTGTSTCTHLNDGLRALADLHVFVVDTVDVGQVSRG